MNSANDNQPGFGRRGEYLVAIQFALMIGFALLPVWHPGIGPHAMDATWAWRSLGALGLGLLSLVFAAMGSHNLREYLTPLPFPVDHSQLVQHGIYRIVRHPLYASLLLAGLAWTLYNLSLSHLLALMLCFAFFDFKARKEEAWLTRRHPEYADYARRVHRFVPWIY